MKNRTLAFISILFISSIFLSSCTNDSDNDTTKNDTPTTEVATSEQYEQIKSANREIHKVIERFFNTESGIFGISKLERSIVDCPTFATENDGTNMTITIDYGDGCQTPDGNETSGRIIMIFNIEPNGDKHDTTDISYTVENIVYDNITINGNARRSFVYNAETGNATYDATSSFKFEWEDGMTGTSESNRVKEIFREETQGLPGQDPFGYGFDFYSLTTGNSSTQFSNDDTYSSEITTPLRYESICGYIVSGIQSTIENREIITLDFGDGRCDNIATETDSDGNETTIELWQ